MSARRRSGDRASARYVASGHCRGDERDCRALRYGLDVFEDCLPGGGACGRTPSCAKTRLRPDLRRHCPVEAVGGSFCLGNLSPMVTARDGQSRTPLNGASALSQAPAMDSLPSPLTFFLLLFAGWINRHQQAVIDYLLEENRVLRAVTVRGDCA
jgi:hypothetical protein